jgi:uncharacterized membrane protein YkvA (DUF1232 family)
MLRFVGGVAAALIAAWLLFVAIMYVARPDDRSLREAARLLPDTLRLLRRLATDTDIARRVRWVVWVLVVYLALPIDLVPDFIPVVGYADDLILVALVLRHVLRRSGTDKLREHWPGKPEELVALHRMLRLGEPN